MSAVQYAEQLQALLPPGAAFAGGDGSDLHALLAGLAQELERVDVRGDDLLAQVFPDTTTELLEEWERVCGLPDECMTGLAQTDAERQAAVVARLTQNDTPTVAFLVAAAAALGYDITITENRARRFGASYGTAYGGPGWNFTFTVALTSGTPFITRRQYGASYGADYATVIDSELLCTLGHLKPAHTVMFIT